MKLGCFGDMDGPRVYLQSKVSQKEKNKYCIYLESRKMVQRNLFAEQK